MTPSRTLGKGTQTRMFLLRRTCSITAFPLFTSSHPRLFSSIPCIR